MKKYLIALTLFIAVAVAFADSGVWVYQSDGTRYYHNYSTFDSLSRVAPGTLALSQSERIVPCEGETFNLDIYANQSWTASVSDASRIQLSKTHGNGNDLISVNVAANKLDTQVYDTITVKLADGTQNAIHLTVEVWQDYLDVNPLSQKFLPAGGIFKVGVTSNTSWKVDNNADWVSLDKTSGMLNDSITVKVSPSDTEKTTQSILTVRTPNKAILHSVVTRIGDEISISPSRQTFSPLGDSYKIYVSSNTSWTVSASEPWVTFDKTNGTLNDSIVVKVGKGDKDAASATITITTVNGETETCVVAHNGDSVSVNPKSKTFAPAGGTYKIGVQSNTDWTVSASEPWVTFDKTSSTLNDSVVVYIEKSDNVESTSAIIAITTFNEKTTQSEVIREGDAISTSTFSEHVKYEGGTISVAVSSNTDWIANVDKNWIELSRSSGCGDYNVTIFADPGIIKSQCDTANITFVTSLGKVASVIIYRDGYTGSGDAITDINGRSYQTVWINGQNWMAENLMCDRYDTESEAYNAFWLTNNTVPTSSDGVYTPYYTDATDKAKWSSKECASNLTSGQIAKLGYRYNWAAAVGVENGIDRTTEFTGNRQGICPNGWHVPTQAEWQTLYDYIYSAQGLSANTVGQHLKTTSGWYNNGNGTDSYGFAVLPSGYSYGSEVSAVGCYADFWTATSNRSSDVGASQWGFGYDYDNLYCYYSSNKDYGQSVRCLRD